MASVSTCNTPINYLNPFNDYTATRYSRATESGWQRYTASSSATEVKSGRNRRRGKAPHFIFRLTTRSKSTAKLNQLIRFLNVKRRVLCTSSLRPAVFQVGQVLVVGD